MTAENRNNQPWTRKEQDELRALFEEGYLIDTISKRMHRSPNAIVTRLCRLKLLVSLKDEKGYFVREPEPVITYEELRDMMEVYRKWEERYD